MSAPYRFVRDLASLPTYGFGNRSLTWWGVILFMMMEGTGFALTGGAYFFLMAQQQHWPPSPIHPPDVLAGTLFTLLILLSEIPNTLAKKHAEAKQIAPVRLLLVLMSAIGAILLFIRAFEFDSLNVLWTDNPDGSIVWALLILHTTHIATDWFDTVVLTALMFTKHGNTGKRFVDVSENSLYWRFVWLAWLPIYLLIYWVPRW